MRVHLLVKSGAASIGVEPSASGDGLTSCCVVGPTVSGYKYIAGMTKLCEESALLWPTAHIEVDVVRGCLC